MSVTDVTGNDRLLPSRNEAILCSTVSDSIPIETSEYPKTHQRNTYPIRISIADQLTPTKTSAGIGGGFCCISRATDAAHQIRPAIAAAEKAAVRQRRRGGTMIDFSVIGSILLRYGNARKGLLPDQRPHDRARRRHSKRAGDEARGPVDARAVIAGVEVVVLAGADAKEPRVAIVREWFWIDPPFR